MMVLGLVSAGDGWRAVNDGVMGGISQGRFQVVQFEGESVGQFSGVVSLDYGGGFASIRKPFRFEPAANRMALRVKGDGHTYQLRLRTHGRLDGLVYAAVFDTEAGQWQNLSFSETDFTAVYRGRAVPDAPPLRFADVQQLGFLIAHKQAGAFELLFADP